MCGNRRWSSLPSVLRCYSCCSSTSTPDELSGSSSPSQNFCLSYWNRTVILDIHIRLTSVFILLFADIDQIWENYMPGKTSVCTRSAGISLLNFQRVLSLHVHSWDTIRLRASLFLCTWGWGFPTVCLPVSAWILIIPSGYRSEIWVLKFRSSSSDAPENVGADVEHD